MFSGYLAVLFPIGTWTLALRAAPGIVGLSQRHLMPSGIYVPLSHGTHGISVIHTHSTATYTTHTGFYTESLNGALLWNKYITVCLSFLLTSLLPGSAVWVAHASIYCSSTKLSALHAVRYSKIYL